MGTRKRTKMNGLEGHFTPDGRGYRSPKNKCETQVRKLQRLIDEGWAVTHKVEEKKENGFKLFGTITLDIPVEILIKAGFRK